MSEQSEINYKWSLADSQPTAYAAADRGKIGIYSEMAGKGIYTGDSKSRMQIFYVSPPVLDKSP